MSSQSTITSELIARLNLQVHPEGGYFCESYRSSDSVIRSNDHQTRSAATAIYYLLCDGAHSRWHRIQSDEMWHFYAGSPLHIHVLGEHGRLTTLHLGNVLMDQNAMFQALVRAGSWFAAECVDPKGFALVGCTVAPGFEFSEFELADQSILLKNWPEHRSLIERLS